MPIFDELTNGWRGERDQLATECRERARAAVPETLAMFDLIARGVVFGEVDVLRGLTDAAFIEVLKYAMVGMADSIESAALAERAEEG